MKEKIMRELVDVIEEKGVMVKISGKALGTADGAPYSQENVEHIINEICSIYESLQNPKIVVVVGGGNIWRGGYGKEFGIEGASSDEIGIFATITNAMMISKMIARKLGDNKVEVMLTCTDNSAETYSRKEAKKALEKRKILVLGGGIGTTGMSTDFVAVNRAVGLELGAVLMAKDGTDGVYDRRPEEEGARKYETLNYKDFVVNELKVADNIAVMLAKERAIPMVFFDFFRKGAFKEIIGGNNIGTLVGNVSTCFAK